MKVHATVCLMVKTLKLLIGISMKLLKNIYKNNKKLCLTIFGLVILVLIGVVYYIFDGLPSLEELENPKPSLATIVLTEDGEEIGRFYKDESRVEANIDSIPKCLINALIATEDKKFYDHWGVDIERFFQGLFKTFVFGRREGASTITQQLAKNLYGFKGKNESYFGTIIRKIREWITAFNIERTYTKNEILEMYLNVSYFGKGAYGIERASRIFFNKPVRNLTISESAVLIAILPSSVVYDPVRHPDRLLKRRNLILGEMLEEDFISESEFNYYKKLPLGVQLEKTKRKYKGSIAPYFVEYIRQQLEDIQYQYGFDIYKDGLTIYTTLNSKMQKYANQAVIEHMESFQQEFDKRWNWNANQTVLNEYIDKTIKARPEYIKAKSNEEKQRIYYQFLNREDFIYNIKKTVQTIEVGFVALDAKNGHIKAMIGGRDVYNGSGLNHATQILRQPGSSFKPIIYSVALARGLFPAFPILNQPFDYEGWSPRNFETNDVGGYMTLRDALRNSVNLVAARLVIEGYVPLWQVAEHALKMGIKNRLNLYPSISLGASEVYPIELISAFGTIANKGIYNKPVGILGVDDKDGMNLVSFHTQSSEALDEATAYILTNMMESVINSGTGGSIRSRFNFQRPAAGKTGTNSDYKDAWFIGFTPQLVAGVWVGFNDTRVTFTGSYGQGAKAALPIWAKFMKSTYDSVKMPIEYFQKPADGSVTTVEYCRSSIYESGRPTLYSPNCHSGVLSDIMRKDDIPNISNIRSDSTYRFFNKYEPEDSLSQ